MEVSLWKPAHLLFKESTAGRVFLTVIKDKVYPEHLHSLCWNAAGTPQRITVIKTPTRHSAYLLGFHEACWFHPVGHDNERMTTWWITNTCREEAVSRKPCVVVLYGSLQGWKRRWEPNLSTRPVTGCLTAQEPTWSFKAVTGCLLPYRQQEPFPPSTSCGIFFKENEGGGFKRFHFSFILTTVTSSSTGGRETVRKKNYK